jgi:ankyrin repeat protein
VYCQLEVLRHCFPSSVPRILEELPESLDETYERILREIRKPNQGHAHRLLQCLAVAVRPLEVKELAEVIAFDFNTKGIPKLNLGWRWEDQEEAVMSACSSLVMIVKDGDSRVVQFSHFSVKEFLTADRLAEPIRDVSRYQIRLEAAHTILVRACLGVLLQLDDRIDRDSIEDFPLARYAAQYWVTHARIENVSSWIKDGMECLFDADKPHFATWLWIHNEDDQQGDLSMYTMCPEEPKAVPLYYAARFGFCDLAEHLIAKNPEHVNARGGGEMTPIHVAASEGHSNILSLLIKHGADVNGQGTYYDNTPLHRASRNARLEAVQFLLKRGADIDARNEFNRTALGEAAIEGHIEFARMLLERGAVIDARDIEGETPLCFAAFNAHIGAMRLLLEHGADVNVRNEDGETPLHFAVFNAHIGVVRLLLEHGADVNVRNEDGETPSELASMDGYQGIVELLSAYSAKSVNQ